MSSQSPTKIPRPPHYQIPVDRPRKPASVTRLPGLLSSLKEVAAQRSKFHCQKVALLLRWDDDDTGAEDDQITMETILKQVGIKCIMFSIEHASQEPIHGIGEKIKEVMDPLGNSSLPSLFVFYYSGHADVGKDGVLRFTSHGEEVRWDYVFARIAPYERMDHLIILDCCHTAAAIREPDAKHNIHLMAAVGADDTTPAREGRLSFTQRIFRAFYTFKGQEKFTTAEWFEQIQAEKPKFAPDAVFETFRGTGAINLIWDDFKPARLPRPISGVSKKHVLVKLTLEGERDVVDRFSQAVRQLPPAMKVDIRDAFETDASVFFVLQMSWQGWVLWTSITHLEFIGTTLGPSLVSRAAIPPVEASGENIPIGSLSLKDR